MHNYCKIIPKEKHLAREGFNLYNDIKAFQILNIFIFCLLLNSYSLVGQNSETGTLKIERVVFRPAQWEQEQLQEIRNERPNKGGLVFVYYKNTSNEAVRIARFLINGNEEGYYTQAGDVAWTRSFDDNIHPGETKVYEINAVSDIFSAGKDFSLSLIDRKRWSAIAKTEVILEEEQVHISSIIWEEDLKQFTLHLQSNSDKQWDITKVSISGKEVIDLNTTASFVEPFGHIILSGKVKEAFYPGDICIASIELENEDETLSVFGHRTCYDSYFAIGTWGIDEHRFEEAKKKLHLNTFIRGGKSTDAFYTTMNKEYGFKVLTHTGMYPDIDKINDLKNTEDIAFWYLQDEPDYNRTAEAVLFSNQMTKKYDSNKPTLVTLCRNVRFFEFAFIPDVACMDHYSVGAPTSSVWPYTYGTKLEETGYYTRDLRLAAFPKPIWVWSQGLFNWNKRPKQQVPTAKELTYQLLSNIGNGAKGILWFTIKENKAEKYPETYLAMQQCGRIMEMLKDDLIHGEPLKTKIESDSNLLIHPIISKDKLILIVLNSGYTIDPVAYQWKPKQGVHLLLKIPSWLKVESAYELIPEEGVRKTSFQLKGNSLSFHIKQLEAYIIFVFDTKNADLKKLSTEYSQLKQMEE